MKSFNFKVGDIMMHIYGGPRVITTITKSGKILLGEVDGKRKTRGTWYHESLERELNPESGMYYGYKSVSNNIDYEIY